MANIHKTLIKDLSKKKYTVVFYDDRGISDPENATSIMVESKKFLPEPITINLPSKKIVDVKWVLFYIEKRNAKIQTASIRKNSFEAILESICHKVGVEYFETIYPTTYGFGLSVSNNANHKRVESKLLGILDAGDIDYEVVKTGEHNTQFRVLGSAENTTKITKIAKLLNENLTK